MTCPNNLIETAQGTYLSVNEHGNLIVKVNGNKFYWNVISVIVNTFDFPPSPLNCNEEFYLNHKVKPGYVTE